MITTLRQQMTRLSLMFKNLTKKSTSETQEQNKLFFNKQKVIEDFEFYYSPMDIVKFLKNKKGALYNCTIKNQHIISVIDISCQKYNVNPKLILSVLERHNNLITRIDKPPVEVYNRAMNLGVSINGIIPSLEGLDKQIHNSIINYRKWFDLYNIKKAGKINCIDEDTVQAENAATYALYMMDPYVGRFDLYTVKPIKDVNNTIVTTEKTLKYKAPYGVYLTWKIWKGWFN